MQRPWNRFLSNFVQRNYNDAITMVPITNVVLLFSWLLSNCAVSGCPSVLCVLVWRDVVIDGPWTVYVCLEAPVLH